MATFGINVVTPATGLPVSAPEWKRWARILGDDVDDTLVDELLQAATEWIERETFWSFLPTVWQLTIDQFPYYVINRVVPFDYKRSALMLPRNPVISVDEILYTDQDGSEVELTEFQVSKKILPGRVLPIPGQTWPFANPYAVDTVNITFTAGYADAAAVPATAKMAIKFLTSHFFECALVGGGPLNVNAAVSEMPYTLKCAINKLRYRGFTA